MDLMNVLVLVLVVLVAAAGVVYWRKNHVAATLWNRRNPQPSGAVRPPAPPGPPPVVPTQPVVPTSGNESDVTKGNTK